MNTRSKMADPASIQQVPPLAPNRSLVVHDRQAMLSADAIRRIVAEANQQTQKLQTLKFLELLSGTSGAAIGVAILIVFGALAGANGIFFWLFTGGVAWAVLTLWNVDSHKDRVAAARAVRLPCPACHATINLTDPWTCGNCKHEHNTEGDKTLTAPVSKCVFAGCSQPIQTAFQCPKCHRHIVLNEDMYLSMNSHSSPFPFVARFSDDESAPVPNQPGNSFVENADNPFDD